MRNFFKYLLFLLLVTNPLSLSAWALTLARTTTKLIPLPVYATLPNEGSTYGFMPVFLMVENASERTQSILAPSVSWNRIIQYTTTFRWYFYPTPNDSIHFIPSLSSNVNRNLTLEYQHFHTEPGELTHETNLHFRRSLFYRFFGLGPYTEARAEASYTRLGGDVLERVGINLAHNLNLGLGLEFKRDLAERIKVDFLPLAHDRFANVVGLNEPISTLYEFVTLRFDDRRNREYSDDGFFAELKTGVIQDLSQNRLYSTVSAEAKELMPQSDRFIGSLRGYFSYVGGSQIPFNTQNSLGGSFLLRGFTENRFTAKGAWEVELEERIALLKTRIMGVTAHWRIDPFIAVGQVFEHAHEMLAKVRPAAGLGFRAFVAPNVLGRIDTAIAGEGLKIYVELGYPF